MRVQRDESAFGVAFAEQDKEVSARTRLERLMNRLYSLLGTSIYSAGLGENYSTSVCIMPTSPDLMLATYLHTIRIHAVSCSERSLCSCLVTH